MAHFYAEAASASKPLAKKALQKLLLEIYFDIIRSMETLNATELLAALSHESRLTIFRMLVEAGPEGMNASVIGEQLGIPAPTLSFHLAHLRRVGLIRSERESRFIHYSADYTAMDELIAFLTHNCCQGNACLPKTSSINSTAKRRSRKPQSATKGSP